MRGRAEAFRDYFQMREKVDMRRVILFVVCLMALAAFGGPAPAAEDVGSGKCFGCQDG